MAAQISLGKGLFAVIDDEDSERVRQYKWHIHNSKRSKTSYAAACLKGKTILLHRFVLRASIGVGVDHINGNGLDCRKENLRVASPEENVRNRGLTSRNTSGYKGVFKNCSKWQAIISVNCKLIALGTFSTKEEAARAYDDAARKYHGKFARTNFE